MTDGSFMDVQVFYGESPPIVEQMLSRIDFDKTDELVNVLTQLRRQLNCKTKDDYAVLHYHDCGKNYLFHMKCHSPSEQDYTLQET